MEQINSFDEEYHKLLNHILKNGDKKEDRTGTGTTSIFGYQMRFDLSKGFPLLTTKKVYMRMIIHELLWFLTGTTNIQALVKNNVTIWNEWAFQGYLEGENLDKSIERYSDEWKEKLAWFVEEMKTNDEFAKKWGDLGPVYGKQWRRWEMTNGEELDQIELIIDMIKNDPTSRRIIVSGWNIGDIEELVRDHNRAPPPCHTLFHFMVIKGKLSCQLYQRSADVFLGVPFNIASYALLTMMIAKLTGLEVGEFIHTFGDVHIYDNHIEQVKEQLTRNSFAPPKMIIKGNQVKIEDFKFEDFEVVEYKSHPPIKAPIAV